MSMLAHALKLLEQRGKALDPIAVLNELPPSIPIKYLRGFLDQVTHDATCSQDDKTLMNVHSRRFHTTYID